MGVAIDDSGCGGIHCGCGLSCQRMREGYILYSSCSLGGAGIVAGRWSEFGGGRFSEVLSLCNFNRGQSSWSL